MQRESRRALQARTADATRKVSACDFAVAAGTNRQKRRCARPQLCSLHKQRWVGDGQRDRSDQRGPLGSSCGPVSPAFCERMCPMARRRTVRRRNGVSAAAVRQFPVRFERHEPIGLGRALVLLDRSCDHGRPNPRWRRLGWRRSVYVIHGTFLYSKGRLKHIADNAHVE